MHNFLAAGKQIPAKYLLSSGIPEWIFCCISTLQSEVVCPALFKISKRSCQLCSYYFRSPFISITQVSHFNSLLSYRLHKALEKCLLTAGYICHLPFKLRLFAVLDLFLSSWSHLWSSAVYYTFTPVLSLIICIPPKIMSYNISYLVPQSYCTPVIFTSVKNQLVAGLVTL